MNTAEEATIQNSMNKTAYDRNKCCKNCAGEDDSQHAHCGKAYIIERGILKETSLKHFYDSNTWQLNTLTTHIYNEFHLYFYGQEPLISAMLEDLTIHPVACYSDVQNLARLFVNLKNTLTAHFLVEENVLFPHIDNMMTAQKKSAHLASSGLKTINASVFAMESDHDDIKDMLEEIKAVTNHFSAPPNAPESFALLYRKLEGLNDKVQQHIYMENNILYPGVLLLQKELIKLSLL